MTHEVDGLTVGLRLFSSEIPECCAGCDRSGEGTEGLKHSYRSVSRHLPSIKSHISGLLDFIRCPK